MLLLAGLVLAAVVYVSERIHRTQLGRLLRAVRDDEETAAGAGANPLRLKMIAMLVGGGSAGVAGCLYAHYMAYIEPNTFGLAESLLIFGMVVIGGLGNTWGAIIGAAVLTTLPEVLRFAGMTQTHAATLRQLVFGALLIAIMALRPSGILGERIGRWRTE
jgi:branched-chain amino acid transport system permease protein